MSDTDRPKMAQALREAGYRLTQPRLAILQVLQENDEGLHLEEVYQQGKTICPSLGLVTVYRTLEKLEQLELVQRVHQHDECNMYLRAPQGHEHLLLCKACGQMEYFRGDDLSELIKETSRKSGYQIQEHWLQLFGLCASCQNSSPIGQDE